MEDERISHLEQEKKELVQENKHLREELASAKTTVKAVAARSINARPDAKKRKRHKKAGRKNGHEEKSRKKPERIDAKVEIDQNVCSECGTTSLSEMSLSL